jgi:tetratricopeptide (TPR) repeat protein
MKLPAGTRLGSYEIVSLLGEGGMGEVYKARDTRLGRFVALKVLPSSLAADREFRERFDREARAIAALTHPHIVTIHSIEEEAGAPFLTMELVDGRTLGEIIPPGGLTVREFFDLAVPLADAVAAAHRRGITHRDLKPGNIMVTTEGRVKVLDFGLAKLTESVPGGVGWSGTTELLTDEGHILGTVAYMSPEQAEGKPIDSRSDIFSLGIIYYEMATGQRPFSGDSNTSLLSSILRDHPQPVSQLNASMPPGLTRLIHRCLEKNPATRIQTAIDLRNTLEELRHQADVAVVPRPTFLPDTTMPLPPARSARSRRGLLVAAGVLASAAAIAVVLEWGNRRPDMQPPPRQPDVPGAAADPSKAGEPVVAVSRFENRTGDPSLGPVGQMAADAVSQELPQLEFAGRVGAGGADVRAARKRAVVTGAYYLDGSNLRIQAWLSDTSGGILHAAAPAVAPRTDPGQAVRIVQQRILGALVTLLDPAYLPGPLTRPMMFDAYREYQAGMELYGSDNTGALAHLQRAAELDPDYAAPALQIAAIHGETGDRVKERDALARLASMRDRLSRMERLLLDYTIQSSDERPLDALKTLREAERLQNDNRLVNYLIATNSVRVGRPQDAIEELGRIDAEHWNAVPAGAWRYGVLAAAYHLLGRHDEELRVARTAQTSFPSSVLTRGQEMNALGALGRIDELRRAADETLTLNVTPRATPGAAIREAAEELRAHGRRMEAIDFALVAVRWYRTRSPDVQQREPSRFELARALYVAERWPEAADTGSALVKDRRDNSAYLGLAGAVAARRGDRKAARKAYDQLARMPADEGQVPLLRARIAALLGEREQALGLLRDAVAKGVPFGTGLHRDMDFETLRGWPAFDDFVKPRDRSPETP